MVFSPFSFIVSEVFFVGDEDEVSRNTFAN